MQVEKATLDDLYPANEHPIIKVSDNEVDSIMHEAEEGLSQRYKNPFFKSFQVITNTDVEMDVDIDIAQSTTLTVNPKTMPTVRKEKVCAP